MTRITAILSPRVRNQEQIDLLRLFGYIQLQLNWHVINRQSYCLRFCLISQQSRSSLEIRTDQNSFVSIESDFKDNANLWLLTDVFNLSSYFS